MTSLFDLDENSSDSEEDIDYVPQAEELSEISDEGDSAQSDDEQHATETTKKRNVRTKNKRSKSPDVLVKKVSQVNEKEKANEVWKSFLEEVAEVSQNETKAGVSSPQSSTNCTPVSLHTENCVSPVNTSEKISDKTCENSEEVIADVKTDLIETKDTASLQDSKSVEDKPAVPANVKRKGLDSVLGTILNKKQKVNTLQKSLMDWKSFKKDEGIEDDLSNFNRGKGGFIERQRFLERSDLRSYERERDLKLTKTKKT